MEKLQKDVDDLKFLLSLILNGRMRELSSAEQLAFKHAIDRLGLVIHPARRYGLFETGQNDIVHNRQATKSN